MLDPPEVPEKKSFPPRATIMVLTTMLSLVVGALWVMTRTAWQEMEPTDPRKAVMIEVWTDMRASMPWNHRNGTTNSGAKG